MAETLIILPLLLLLSAGAFQFSLAFLAKVRFEHACGEAAREYAAGLLQEKEITKGVIDRLGAWASFFVPGSIHARAQSAGSRGLPSPPNGPGPLGRSGPIRQGIQAPIPLLMDYKGQSWQVQARIRPNLLFIPVFKDARILRARFFIARHPKGARP
jgi:hypothetical protein